MRASSQEKRSSGGLFSGQYRDHAGSVAAFVTGRFRGSDDSGDWPCRGEVARNVSNAAMGAKDAI